MTHYTKLWKFETARFAVILDCCDEQHPDLSWADDETLDKLNMGEWVNVSFRVRVLCDGVEVGADYLSNSIYADVHDFHREHFGIRPKSRDAKANYGSYFTDMVFEAIHAARKTVSSMPAMRGSTAPWRAA